MRAWRVPETRMARVSVDIGGGGIEITYPWGVYDESTEDRDVIRQHSGGARGDERRSGQDPDSGQRYDLRRVSGESPTCAAEAAWREGRDGQPHDEERDRHLRSDDDVARATRRDHPRNGLWRGARLA